MGAKLMIHSGRYITPINFHVKLHDYDTLVLISSEGIGRDEEESFSQIGLILNKEDFQALKKAIEDFKW